MITRIAKGRLRRLIYRRLQARTVDCAAGQPLVSFTFDDFPETALTVGGAILESFGWRGTYYTAMGLAGTETECGRVASEADVRACQAAGHQIAHHTFSHLNCAETDFATVRADVQRNITALGDLGTNDFAYPFGASDETSMARLGHIFDSCRGIAPGVNGEGTDLNNLRANAVYSAAGMDRHFRAVEAARGRGGWLIFYTHDVCAQPSAFGCTPEDFHELAGRVAERGLRVLTVREALDAILGAVPEARADRQAPTGSLTSVSTSL